MEIFRNTFNGFWFVSKKLNLIIVVGFFRTYMESQNLLNLLKSQCRNIVWQLCDIMKDHTC